MFPLARGSHFGAGFGKKLAGQKWAPVGDSEHVQMAVGQKRGPNPATASGKNIGCGSKLKRRGKPQVLVHVSTCQGQPFWCRFW